MLSQLTLCLLATVLPQRPAAARVEIGWGASNGELGVSVSRDLFPWLRVEGGVGLGLSGIQVSSLGRLVLGDATHRFVPGAGVSVGLPLLGGAFRREHDGPLIVMPWLNVDALAYEYMNREGFTLSVALGATGALGAGHWDAMEMGDSVRPLEDWFPQFHVAFGSTF